MATKHSKAKQPSERELAGRALAMRLLYEFDAEGAADRCSIEPRYWPRGAAQELPLLRYLQILRERNSPDEDRGFCEVLSDFISGCLDGAIPPPEFYIRFVAKSTPAEAANVQD